MSETANTKPTRIISERVPDQEQFYPASAFSPPSGTALSADIFPQNQTLPKLFTPITLRGMEFNNRVWVSPMCMYSSHDGVASDFHLVHIGQYALGGAGAIMLEATAVVPEGRISPEDAGIWGEEHIAPLKRIVDFVHAVGGKVGIQLAHAGRKASTYTPWLTSIPGQPRPSKQTAREDENGWPNDVQGPSPIPWSPLHVPPQEITPEGIAKVKAAFLAAIERCKTIGFDFIELHYAHGYLLSSFASPMSNARTDEYGGTLENRTRFHRELATEAREAWPDKPLFVRISATDKTDGNPPEKDENGNWTSWGIEQSKWLTERLAEIGVDLVDVSDSGNWYKAGFFRIEEGYQVPHAHALKQHIPAMTIGAVGHITQPEYAEQVLQDGSADVIFQAREFLRQPYWPLHAAAALGVAVNPPGQYQGAWSKVLTRRQPKL